MATDPLPSMNKVFSLILQFEREFNIGEKQASIQDITSFVNKGKDSFNPGFQNNVTQYGHGFQNNSVQFVKSAKNSSNFQQMSPHYGNYRRLQFYNNRKKPFCSFCNDGHLVANSWKKNGYPPNFKSRFSQANSIASMENCCEQDLVDQDAYEAS